MTILYEKELEDGKKMQGFYEPEHEEEINAFASIVYSNMLSWKQEEIGYDNCQYMIRVMFEDAAFIEQLYNSYSVFIHDYFKDKVEWVETEETEQ